MYDKRHGGPYDRGGADSYYRRQSNPHYYRGATGMTDLVTEVDMTEDELKAYFAGYDDNLADGNFKY